MRNSIDLNSAIKIEGRILWRTEYEKEKPIKNSKRKGIANSSKLYTKFNMTTKPLHTV